MFAPEQHDLYDGHYILSANRIYMVGGLNDPVGWDHMDNDAKTVKPDAGTAEIDVNDLPNTGKFEARLRIPEGDLVPASDKFNEFNPCQNGGIVGGGTTAPRGLRRRSGFGQGHGVGQPPVHATGWRLEALTNLAAAVAASDICVTCTTAESPLLFTEHLHPGLFVAAVGADNPAKQEIDAIALSRRGSWSIHWPLAPPEAIDTTPSKPTR